MEKSMIVHIFNSTLVSGPETLVLPALAELDLPVQIIFLSETRKLLEAQRPILYAKGLGLKTTSIAVGSRYDSQAIRELKKTLLQLNPTVVHAHDVKASTYLWRAVQDLNHRHFKIISTHHGVRARHGLKNRIYELYYSYSVLPEFDRVLCVCSSDREKLIGRGLNPDQVALHLNGVARKLTPVSERALQRPLIHEAWGLESRAIPSQGIILGMVARLAPEKDHARALRILYELKALSSPSDWHLLCFGTGPLENHLKGLSHKLGLSKQVHWMGYRRDIGNEMAGFDLLLSLSQAEGLPINLLEAGWAGTPVVATAVDGNKDLLSTGQEGILVGPEQSDFSVARALNQLISQPQLRLDLGQRLQKRVSTSFSQTVWLTRLQELYQNR